MPKADAVVSDPQTPKNTGNMGKGRPVGAKNKVTRQLKEMILGALDDAGGQEYLAVQAHHNPQAFMALLGRVLPTTLAGDGNNPIKHIFQWIKEPPKSGTS